jgi:HSP20 family protein
MLPALKNRFLMPTLFDDFFGKDNFSNALSEDRSAYNIPAVNVMENNDHFMIDIAAPGLEKKDFHINLENNLLTISSEKEFQNEEEKNGKYVRREFGYSSFKRSFTLPDSIMADKIEANYKDGVLHIFIPKKEEAKQKPPRQIAIS